MGSPGVEAHRSGCFAGEAARPKQNGSDGQFFGFEEEGGGEGRSKGKRRASYS